ncbi:MAG: orotidine 5'-phosphate decarboxylase [Candidatus Thermoplasmatota archaeon]|nr:orotidine 5'-phosphate decarboxylase [Candidatus Thermoplasmatota archaeon]
MSSNGWPVLQIALDEMNLSRALEMARGAVDGGVDWLEAGTPLIKSEGMSALRELKKSFPGMVLVADMKTMDAGGYEVEMAAKSGADVVCVLGAADDDTILEAVRSAGNYGCKIMVDLIGVGEPAKRALEVEKLGVDYVCVHVGIDQQMRGMDPLGLVGAVSSSVSIPVGAAGGITTANAPAVAKAGADIIIVGGGITRAEDVGAATRDIKESLRSGKAGSGERRRYRLEEIREALMAVSTCNISDAMHRRGAMDGMAPVFTSVPKMVGRAFTVQTMDGDWAKPVEAIDLAEPGDVLVIDAKPGNRAVWGELATNSCKVRGLAGVVVDGAVRDVEKISELGVPVFSSSVRPNAGDPKGHGDTGGTIECGGKTVRPGDWIVGDSSGVVVIPREEALDLANRALDVKKKEGRIRAEITGGKKTLSQVAELLKWEKIG